MESTPAALAAPETPRERRLAAVVFTDVVGYSAMMNADEATTITRVGADLARMQAQCIARGGECLNTMGDGLMLAFPSTVQALSFAMETQEEFSQRNEAPSELPLLQHRIGIHLGDVVRMPDGSLAGDGVNIAARLESSAPPGGICISQTVYDTVRGKIPFEATFAGPKTFKNIAQPIAVWHLHPRGAIPATKFAAASAPSRVARRAVMVGAGAVALIAGTGAWWWRNRGGGTPATAFDPKSIAVLPFTNMSDDKDASYFADGMHEDLLTQLALLSQLKVVSRTSVMEYRNTAKKIPQIGSELKVASLVEGSVRRAGNVVRVTAQLVDANSDKHIWAANYDRDLKDIFKVQSELATEIARSLNVSLTSAQQKRLEKVPTANLAAWDLYQKAQSLARRAEGTFRMSAELQRRIDLYTQALALDLNFVLAWSRLAGEHVYAHANSQDANTDHRAAARKALTRALALSPDDLEVKMQLAEFQLVFEDGDLAARSYQEVLMQAPNNAEAIRGLARSFKVKQRIPEAMAAFERAVTIDPRNVGLLVDVASMYARFRHFDRVIELYRQASDVRPDDDALRRSIALYLYWKTGSWDGYDQWRAGAPSAGQQAFDRDRAIARRNFDEVLRLLDDRDAFDKGYKRSEANVHFEKAFVHHAAGDSAKAKAEASLSLAALERYFADEKNVSVDWGANSLLNALLGRRELAFAQHEKAVREEQQGGPLWVEMVKRNAAPLHAILSEPDEAVVLLRRYSVGQGFFVHRLTVDTKLATIWNHPGFLALARDPAFNAPLTLDTPIAGRA